MAKSALSAAMQHKVCRENMDSDVTARKLICSVAVLMALVIALFDVTLNFDFGLPQETELPDAEQEARYQACYEARDAEIHRTAFGTIDNPDVQKEFITGSRARAAIECRAAHPQRTVTATTPFHFNVLDFEPRFW